MHAPVILYISQHTIFEAPSFTDSKDMIGSKIFKNGSRDPDHAHPKASTWYNTCVHNLATHLSCSKMQDRDSCNKRKSYVAYQKDPGRSSSWYMAGSAGYDFLLVFYCNYNLHLGMAQASRQFSYASTIYQVLALDYRMAQLPMFLNDLEGHFCCLKPF